jgi:PII-like signaling protein
MQKKIPYGMIMINVARPHGGGMKMSLSGKVKRLRIYVGSELYYNEKPLYRAILEQARMLDIAGGTVFQGVEGYGAHSRMIRASRFLELSSDLPVVVEIIETEEKLAKLETFLRASLTKGLVTVEDVDVLLYQAKTGAEKDK